jgi:hypothetical protein
VPEFVAAVDALIVRVVAIELVLVWLDGPWLDGVDKLVWGHLFQCCKIANKRASCKPLLTKMRLGSE